MPLADDDSPKPSAGCMNGTLKAGRVMGSIQSSGGARTYIQYLPTSYDGKKPVPLVIDLHPFSVDASYVEASSGFKPLADTEGYASAVDIGYDMARNGLLAKITEGVARDREANATAQRASGAASR